MDNKKYRQRRLRHLLKFGRYSLTIAKHWRSPTKAIYRGIQEFLDLCRVLICSSEQGYYYDKASAGSFERPGTWFPDMPNYKRYWRHSSCSDKSSQGYWMNRPSH